MSGQEVTIVDPALCDSMKDAKQSFGIHKVEWKAIEDNSGDDSGYEGLDSEGVVDTSDTDEDDVVLVANTPNCRTRAAPFFHEFVSG